MGVFPRTVIELFIASCIFFTVLILSTDKSVHITTSTDDGWCHCLPQKDLWLKYADEYPIDQTHKLDSILIKYVFKEYYLKKTLEYEQPINASYYVDKWMIFMMIYSALLLLITFISVMIGSPIIWLPITDIFLGIIEYFKTKEEKKKEKFEFANNEINDSLKPAINKLNRFLKD